MDIDTQRDHIPSIHPILVKKRREDFAITLRKERRKTKISNSRGIIESGSKLYLNSPPSSLNIDETLSSLEKLLQIRRILTENEALAYNSLIYLTTELKKQKEVMIGALVNLGFIEVLSVYLNPRYNQETIRESSDLVCNIASGPHEYTAKLIEVGIVDQLFTLLQNENSDILNNVI